MTDELNIAERIGAAEAAIAQMRTEQQTERTLSEGAEVDHLFGGEPPIVPIGAEASGGAFAWDAETRSISAGYVMVGRKLVTPTGCAEGGYEDGTYAIEVDMETGDAAVVSNGSWQNATDEKAYCPIYRIKDGEVAEDMRGPFCVQRWED